MGNTEQQPERPDPGKTIEFTGEDGMYYIPPDDIFYMTIQPDRQDTSSASKDRSSRAMVVCYLCRHTMSAGLIRTRLRNFNTYLYLKEFGFFHIHRSHFINLKRVRNYTWGKVVFFTHKVAHSVTISKKKFRFFKLAMEALTSTVRRGKKTTVEA
jgi:hypothetical protein